MRKAINDSETWSKLDPLLTGTNAFLLLKGDIGNAVKSLQAFQKETQKSSTKGGLFEGKLLTEDDIKAIAKLPTKEVLMAQIAGSLNSLTSKIAIGINEVPAGLARSLKQHSEKTEG